MENLTCFNELYSEGNHNYRCIFGKPTQTIIVEQQFGTKKKQLWFAPKNIFCISLWDATKAGKTKRWQVYVLMSGTAGETLTSVPQVSPGAHVLMSASGARRCVFLLKWLADIEANADPTQFAPEYYLRRDLWFHSMSPEMNQETDLYLGEYTRQNLSM